MITVGNTMFLGTSPTCLHALSINWKKKTMSKQVFNKGIVKEVELSWLLQVKNKRVCLFLAGAHLSSVSCSITLLLKEHRDSAVWILNKLRKVVAILSFNCHYARIFHYYACEWYAWCSQNSLLCSKGIANNAPLLPTVFYFNSSKCHATLHMLYLLTLKDCLNVVFHPSGLVWLSQN